MSWPGLLAALLVAGCSSVPSFTPSKPIKAANTPGEALQLCSEYKIRPPGGRQADGRLAPSRVVALTPWLHCLEDLFDEFPNTRRSGPVTQLYRALDSRYASAPTSPERTVIDSGNMNFAVESVITHLTGRAGAPFTENETLAISRELPVYWFFLVDRGEINSPSSGRGPARETVSLPPRPSPLSEEQKKYCRRYVEYRNALLHLQELSEYRSLGNDLEKAERERLDARVLALEQRTAAERSELDVELARLKKSTAWFESGFCLEQRAVHFQKR
jgi:hypothetical protein